MDWIGSLMDRYAAACHIQCIKGTLSRKHPESITDYIQALKLQFDDKDAQDEANEDLEKVWYDGCFRDMFTQIQMYNDEAMVSGAALKKIVLVRLTHNILEQMHTIDLTGKTDDQIIRIITNAGRTAEKWKAARKNLGLRKPISEVCKETNTRARFNLEIRFDKPNTFKNRFQGRRNTESEERLTPSNRSNPQFKPRNGLNKTYAEQMEGIDKSELDRRQVAGECRRCAWLGDQMGAH